MGNIKIRLPQLCRGKEWYVYFSFLNPETGRLKRFKKTEGFSTLPPDNQARENYGQSLITKYSGMLRDGWSPLHDDNVIYQDQLAPNNKLLKMREAEYNIEFYLSRFLEAKRLELRDKSFSSYQSKIRKFIFWIDKKFLTRLGPQNFTAAHANEFYLYLLSLRKHSNTIHSYITTMRTAWEWTDNQYEHIQLRNPWLKVKVSKKKGTPQKIFNLSQREHIFKTLKQMNEVHLHLACMLVFCCWIRPGRELHGLQLKDIDLHEGKITIPEKIAKNKKTETIHTPASIIELLKTFHLENYPPNYFLFGTIRNGIHIKAACRDYWSKRFSRIIRKLGYGVQYSMYSWKHSGNQVAHNNGMPLEKQRKQDRHYSLDEMQKYLTEMEIENSDELEGYFK